MRDTDTHFTDTFQNFLDTFVFVRYIFVRVFVVSVMLGCSRWSGSFKGQVHMEEELHC